MAADIRRYNGGRELTGRRNARPDACHPAARSMAGLARRSAGDRRRAAVHAAAVSVRVVDLLARTPEEAAAGGAEETGSNRAPAAQISPGAAEAGHAVVDLTGGAMAETPKLDPISHRP